MYIYMHTYWMFPHLQPKPWVLHCCLFSWRKVYNDIKFYNWKKKNFFPRLSKHITLWPGTLIVSHKISSFAQLPEECCEVFGLLPKPCLSKEVSLKPERRLDPENSSRIFGHPEMVMENYNTDVDTGSFFCCPKPWSHKTKSEGGELKGSCGQWERKAALWAAGRDRSSRSRPQRTTS